MQALRAGRVLTGGVERAGWWVTVDGGTIVEVGASPPASAEPVDLGQCDLVAGLVDLHSDCLEDRARPRPSSPQPLDTTIGELDTEVVSWGITTHFACVALDEAPDGIRTPARAHETLRAFASTESATRARHLVHLRVELTAANLAVAEAIAADPLVHLVSYMDHTPGRGQYADEVEWRAYYGRVGTSEIDLDAALERRYAARGDVPRARAMVADVAHRVGSSLASHDDHDADDVAVAVSLGVRVAEFPVSLEAATAATRAGLGVVMGAPNALRGVSHVGNLSARDALHAGALHALASDYHPPSLLRSLYALADHGICSWADAMSLGTRGPASAIGLDDCGDVLPGRRADLVAVARRDGVPTVVQTWVAGAPAFGIAAARVMEALA